MDGGSTAPKRRDLRKTHTEWRRIRPGVALEAASGRIGRTMDRGQWRERCLGSHVSSQGGDTESSFGEGWSPFGDNHSRTLAGTPTLYAS